MLRWTDAFQNKLDELIQLHEQEKLEGVYEDVPIEVYHHPLCPGFSKSDLDVASRSYEHLVAYKADRIAQYKDPEAEEKRALVIGSAFHDALFTPVRYAELYSVEPVKPEEINRRTKIGKIEYQQWVENVLLPFQREKVGLTGDELTMLQKMQVKANEHETFQQILDGSLKEITIFFRDPKTGILLKVRPDVLNKSVKICLDAKTTEDACPVAFRKSIANYNYDKQAAMQVDGCRQMIGGDWDFIFSAHEKEEPFGIGMYRVDDAVLEVGRTLYRRDLDYLKSVLQDKTLSRGYPKEIVSIGLPAWGFDITSR